MGKTAVILIALVDTSDEKSNGDIEKEIIEELQKFPQTIPWAERVLMVSVS